MILAAEAGTPTIPNGQLGSLTRLRTWGWVRNVAGMSPEVYTEFIEKALYTFTPVLNLLDQCTLIHNNVIVVY